MVFMLVFMLLWVANNTPHNHVQNIACHINCLEPVSALQLFSAWLKFWEKVTRQHS